MSLQINLLNWLKSKFNTKEEITSYLNNKVDKVSGKSLVDNTEITRLGGMETGANKITAGTGLTKSGTALGISNGGVTATQLASNAVETAKIKDANVTTDKLNGKAVTTAKIADSAVTATQIGSNAVTTYKINAKAVTTAKISDGAVTTTQLGSNAVTSAKIADGTITDADIADYSVTNLKLEGHSITQSEPAGYLKLMKIKVNGIYQDSPLKFEIYCRGYTEPIICNVKFANANSTDPMVESFTTKGFRKTVYLYKESTSTWSVIVQKSRFDGFTITYVGKGDYNTCEVSKMEELLSELPTSTTTNPRITGDYIGFTSTEKTKLSGIATGATKNTVSDSLTDSSTTNALSANKGKWLNDNKASSTHNHDSNYVKLSGGQTMTGNILIPSNADSSGNDATGHIPFAHTIQDATKTVREILPTKKSFIGGVIGKKLDGGSGNQYDYVISARHRNGGGDGYKYGMYIRAPFSTNGNLLWAESNGGDYGTEKTILDSGNYSQYANKTTIINDLTTGGTANALSAEQGKWLYNNKAPNSHASTGTGYGVSNASNYGHAMASSTTPKADGTANVGSETAKFARGDHVHPTPSASSVQTLTLVNQSAMSGTVKWVEKDGWATVFWENFKCTTTTTGFTPVANLPSGKGAPATIYGYLNTALTGTNGNGIHFRVGSKTLDCRIYSTSAAMYGHITYPIA